jgi:hypothetical protein
LIFITNDAPLFLTSPSNGDSFDLVVCYRQVTSDGSEPVSLLAGPFLHVGYLMVPGPGLYSLEFCIRRFGFEKCFDDRNGRIQSVLVRSRAQGAYSFPGWLDGVGGNFAASDGRIEFAVEFNQSFVDVLSFQFPRTGTGPFSATAVVRWELLSVAANPSHELVSNEFGGSDSIVQFSDTVFDGFFRAKSSFLSFNQAKGSSAVWIGIGSGFAVVLLIIGGIIVLLVCGRHAFRSVKTLSESEAEMKPPESDMSSVRPDQFVSEENALSADGKFRAQIEANAGRDGILVGHPSNE